MGGSAYAIGRDLLHEVVMEWDGRKEKDNPDKGSFLLRLGLLLFRN